MIEPKNKYYKGSPGSSNFTNKKDDIDFYNESRINSKESISSFITKYGLKKDKLTEYLLDTQKDKYYMLYKDNDINLETINKDNFVIISYTKEPKKSRYVAKTKSGVDMKILLRWKNGNGIALPALQIS